MIAIYVHALTGRVFKILPMREESETIGSSFREYLKSLAFEVSGSLFTFAELADNVNYITAVNIVQNLAKTEFSSQEAKREVFKALELLNLVEAEFGGVKNV